MVDVQLFPQLIGRRRQIVLLLEYSGKGTGKVFIEVDMAEHDKRVAAADIDRNDAVARTQTHAPFVRRALLVLGSVIGLPHVRLEGVLDEVVVGRAYERVAQTLAHRHERGMVVPRGVFLVHDDGHAVLLFKVEEVLLLVPCHHSDVVDAGLLKLADLTLDQNLSTNMQQTFGLLVGNRGEPRRQASCQDDSVVHLKRSERLEPGVGQCAVDDKPFVDQRFVGRVHRTQRHGLTSGDRPLARPRFAFERSEHREFVLRDQNGASFHGRFRRSRSCVEVHFLLHFKESERYVHLQFSTTKYEHIENALPVLGERAEFCRRCPSPPNQ